MTGSGALNVVVVGGSPEKMKIVKLVLEARGFATTGVFSEEDARRVIGEYDELLAVVVGGAFDDAVKNRLREAAAPKGAVLIAAAIGHDDPEEHFTRYVIPKLIDARNERGNGP